jgi:hypothetical protein
MKTALAGVQWGDVASWVGSIATSVALLLTYALLLVTRRDQRALAIDQRRSQARKVSAWCEGTEPTGSDGVLRASVRLQNASDEPIYGPRVAVGADWLSPGRSYAELDLNYVLAPQYGAVHTTDVRRTSATRDAEELTLPVEIVFSDAGGRFWHRDRYGGLSEITKGLPPAARDYFFTTPQNTLNRSGQTTIPPS